MNRVYEVMRDTTEHIDLENHEFQAALHLVEHSNRSLFLTGKAGTGKSTFLRYICSQTQKKHVVLAPTGIAAINAGGSTLHSFFKLPFHPLLPDDVKYSPRHIKETLKYNGEKRKMLRELELIIIDEVSMLRADIIDFIDKVLRIYSRNMKVPFGGKQLLLVGDVFQLEPVVREEDRQLLLPYYKSMFFFGAHVFEELPLVSIELKTVYRQNDAHFIRMLDHIRTNQISDIDLRQLNSRVGAELKYSDSQLAITLSARRDTVDYINEQRLASLPGEAISYHGVITGEFPSSSLPTTEVLDLKPGAQIIFVKNDKDRRWVNGTLGMIDSMSTADDGLPFLTIITEDGDSYDVVEERWSNMRYTFNEKEKKIEEEEIGTFTQFPIRLAWAITIHKSQGLTFRQVKIDFSGGVFAAGQAYVALSRCQSLEGISLLEPLRRGDIFVKNDVLRFSAQFNDGRLYSSALSYSEADREYIEALRSFDEGDMQLFLQHFFKAIHLRYDIEKPVVQRFLRRKLDVVNQLRLENERLREEMHKRERFLKKLSAEYTLMGKDCEREHMIDAAIANYRKALELYPEAREPKRRLKKLES
ncbi:MAG: AAA family ATPase [Prevotella sp.]|nr:AAA family ATPase [Prevotella sp.]